MKRRSRKKNNQKLGSETKRKGKKYETENGKGRKREQMKENGRRGVENVIKEEKNNKKARNWAVEYKQTLKKMKQKMEK